MTLTGEQLLDGFSNFIDDQFVSTTTSAGAADNSTLIDTELRQFGDGGIDGRWIRITSGDNLYKIHRISSFSNGSGTAKVQPAFLFQVASGVSYDMHKYHPTRKFAALDAARLQAADDIFKVVFDETITTDGINNEYSIPSTVRRGPGLVFIEEPISPEPGWNFLYKPRMDDVTAWTASGGATSSLSSITRDFADLMIPKYSDSCLKFLCTFINGSSDAVITQAQSAFVNGWSAARSAARTMTFAVWVFCTTTSRVRIEIQDVDGTTQSSLHSGRGWELLTVTRTLAATTNTTLNLRVRVVSTSPTASSQVIYVDRGWFFYGDKLPSHFPIELAKRIRRDDTTQRIMFLNTPPARRQLRLIGKAPLSSITGASHALTLANTMEIDAISAEILYAKAAEILFQWERLNTENMPQVAQRIMSVRERMPELRMNWDMNLPARRIEGPWG